MAVVTNTFASGSAKGNRESVDSVVSSITPEETPIYSMIKKQGAKNTYEEWLTRDLNAPADNKHTEGEEYTFGATTPSVRVGNRTQIFRKEGIISETQEAMDNIGKAEQIVQQKLEKGVELRKDIEYSILNSAASVQGSDSVAGVSGGLPTWYTSNVNRGSGGANGGYNSGTKLTVAPTNGTLRDFSKTIMDDVLSQIYKNGGRCKIVSCSTTVKQKFSQFMSDSNVASFRYSATKGGKKAIIASADIYEGDFGTVTMMPNRVQSAVAGLARNAHFIDPDMLAWLQLRPLKEDKEVSRTGDAKRFVLIAEGTLRVRNQKGLGVAADLN